MARIKDSSVEDVKAAADMIAVVSALVSLLILRSDGHHLHGKQAVSFGPHLAIGLWLTWIAGALQ